MRRINVSTKSLILVSMLIAVIGLCLIPIKAGAEIKELAGFLAVSAQGLWAYARAIDNINDLKKKVRLLIELVKLKLTAMSDNTGSKRTGATA